AEQARALIYLGRCDEALALLDDGDALLVSTGATTVEARLAHYRGLALHARGDVDTAQRQFSDARALAAAAAMPLLAAANDAALGQIAIAACDYRQAQLLCENALAIYRPLGDRPAAGKVALSLGTIAAERGDSERARHFFLTALEVART